VDSANRERELFAACVNLDPSERAARIDEACQDDPALAARVHRLLAAHDTSGLDGGASPWGDAHSTPNDPTDIGPYHIVSRLGEGGMGVVYAAEQTRPIKRRVALKVIKVGMHSKDVIARFESERQALALMNHPNIARILDAGATESGQPYFVMEHVPGVSIVQYCDRERLSIHKRLSLLIEVGKAVEHAHRRGVIHRDLKPSNILVAEVDGRVVPKIIDFGIAKATGHRLTDLTVETRFGQFIGTPDYMSPERTTNPSGSVDARSDVYSLGVVLYELLTGVYPLDLRDPDLAIDEILRIIREVDPLAPSVRIAKLRKEDAASIASNRSSSPVALRRALRGPLDRITMVALAKDRTRRYSSAATLVEDVERFSSGAPIAARPARLSRRLRRSLWQILAAALVVGVSIAAGIALTLTTRGNTSNGDAPAPPRMLVLPFQFLGSSNDAYLAEGIAEEIRHRLNDVTTLSVLGRQTALFAAARAMSPRQMADELDADFILDGSVRLQREGGPSGQMRIRASLTDARSGSQIWTDTFERPMDNVFDVQVDVAARVVQAVGVQLPAPDARVLESRPTGNAQAYQYFLRANDYARRGELEPDMRTALELYYEAGRLDPNFAPAWAAVSVMRSRIAWRGYDQSAINLHLAREAGERALRIDPGNADGHSALGYYNYYGFRDYHAALMHFNEANQRRPEDPQILDALGLVHRRLGEWDQAVASLEAALRLDPKNTQVAISLGETDLAIGDYVGAEERFDQAIAFSPDRPEAFLFKAWLDIASKDDTQSAIAALRQGWDAVGGARLFSLLGRYLSDLDWWLSRVLAREVGYQEMFEAIDPWSLGIDSAAYYLHAAEFHDALNHRDKSRAYYDSTRTVLQARLKSIGGPSGDPMRLAGDEPSEQANALMWLGVAYAGLGVRDSAISVAQRGAEIFTAESDALHGSEGLIHLGLVYALVGDQPRAAEVLERALSRPSSFRIDMLKHDPRLRSLLDDVKIAK
jgi:serine/threonine protein kinase/tetratricopeptide (TPR) repeat protein